MLSEIFPSPSEQADDERELHQVRGREFGRIKRLVRGTEIDRARLDLGNAAARTDGLVVDPGLRRRAIVGRPLGHDRIDEGGAGADDIGGRRDAAGREGQRGDEQLALERTQHDVDPQNMNWKRAVTRLGSSETPAFLLVTAV